MIDKQKIQECIREILIALGEDPNREGLIETPSRVANMYEEVFEGIQYTNDEIVQLFDKCFKDDLDTFFSNGVIWVKDIECFSFCEHHMALIYDLNITIAYKPKDKVIGLSKIARIVDLVSKRLQIQERMASDIFYIIQNITNSDDILILIEGKHGCLTARGIKKTQATTFTTLGTGMFSSYQPEFSKGM